MATGRSGYAVYPTLIVPPCLLTFRHINNFSQKLTKQSMCKVSIRYTYCNFAIINANTINVHGFVATLNPTTSSGLSQSYYLRPRM